MAFTNNPLSGRLIVVIGTVLSIPAALFMGRLAAQGNTSQIGLILAGLFGMLFLLGLQDKVWWLIPIAFAMNLPPIPFAGRQLQLEEVCTIGAFGIFFARFLMHKQHLVLNRKENLSVFLYFGWVFMVYAMNPVGFSSLGAGEGGGRFYLTLIIALLSFLIVSQQSISEFEAKWIVRLFILGAFINMVWSFLLNTVFPASVALGSGVIQVEGDYTWHQAMAGPAFMMILYLFSRYKFSEVFSMARPWTILVIAVALLLALLSGKRAVLMATLLVPAIAAAIRKDWLIVAFGALFAGLFLVALAMGHDNLYKLPYGMQRAISFVPGMRLDSDVREDVESEFRSALRDIAMEKIEENPWVGRKGYKVDFDMILDSIYGQALSIETTDYRSSITIQRFAMQGSWHTTWLGIAADFGIPAAIIFLFFYVQMILLGLSLLKSDFIKHSVSCKTLVTMITIGTVISLLRSWTSGHSTLVAQTLWWQYGLLVALKHLPYSLLVSSAKDDPLETHEKPVKRGIQTTVHH